VALLDEIIELAVDAKEPVTTLLRKCLVLAHKVKNQKLREWAEKELEGYGERDELPPYRRTAIIAKGFFIGPLGAQIHDQPLTPSVLKEHHRHFAEEHDLRQPIAVYDQPLVLNEASSGETKQLSFVIQWPADLTAHYQTSFFRGYVLNRAWIEVPNTVLIAMIDLVRNRILKFALEVQDQVGGRDIDPASLPPSTVEQSVVNNIFGGTVVIAGTASSFVQGRDVIITKGDMSGLVEALKKLGIDQTEVQELQSLFKDNPVKAGSRTLHGRILEWIEAKALSLANKGLDISTDVAKAEMTHWIIQYLGVGGS
jgi:hypothetical protein